MMECSICSETYDDDDRRPVICNLCFDNAGCKACYQKMKESQQCRCSCGLLVEGYATCNPILGLLHRAMVFCQHEDRGCGWQGPHSEQRLHLMRGCMAMRYDEQATLLEVEKQRSAAVIESLNEELCFAWGEIARQCGGPLSAHRRLLQPAAPQLTSHTLPMASAPPSLPFQERYPAGSSNDDLGARISALLSTIGSDDHRPVSHAVARSRSSARSRRAAWAGSRRRRLHTSSNRGRVVGRQHPRGRTQRGRSDSMSSATSDSMSSVGPN
jgi:hypothetical protein